MDRGEALNNYLASIGEPTFIFFGPHANCTAELCSYRWSVYGYRPEMSANVFFMCVFFALLVAHVVIGARRKAWAFMSFMIAGCADEILGYAGRVCMYYDLWNFKAFMVQVVCITTAPVFFCAAIYMVLAKSIDTFAPALSRFPPALLFWVFIPCDLVSLVLQGAGGALSAMSSGISQTGVNIALAGLALQVVTLVTFCAIYMEFLVRYYRSGMVKRQSESSIALEPACGQFLKSFGARLTIFYVFEILAIVLILVRCAFRLEELRFGYSGPLVKRQDLFVGLEGVLIVVAVLALCVGHPGLIFSPAQMRKTSATTTVTVDEGRIEK